MTYRYAVYGLVLELPFECPVLFAAPRDATPDVVVTEGTVARNLDSPKAAEANWEAEPGRFLLRGGRRSGRFLVEDGTRITLERNPGAEEAMLGFHFLSSVLAALLRQRGLLVLHANAALTPDGAIAVAGVSGAGKSTTLAALLARGCSLLSDDVTALRFNGRGQADVLPGVPQLHLTDEGAAAAGRNIDGLPRYPWRRLKAAVPAHAETSLEVAPLRALYVLEIQPRPDLCMTRLEGAEKFGAVQDCVYGPVFAEEHPSQFPLVAEFTSNVEVYQIRRPQDRSCVHQVADMVL